MTTKKTKTCFNCGSENLKKFRRREVRFYESGLGGLKEQDYWRCIDCGAEEPCNWNFYKEILERRRKK